MADDEQDLRERLAAVGRMLFAEGLTPGSSGNISARVSGSSSCLIKASGYSFRDLKPEQFLSVDIKTRRVLKGEGKPSIETPFHTTLYNLRGDIGGVVHVHPHYATVFSIAGVNIIPMGMEIYRAPALAEGVGISRYAPPGTEELAQNIAEAMKDRFAVLMPHHGVTVIGATIEDAANNARVLEELARLNYEVLQIGKPQRLPRSVLNQIIETAKKTGGMV